MSQHKTIYLKTTGACNLDCKHCFTGGKTGDKTQFDPEKTLGWIKEYVSRHDWDTSYHVEFHGGEPFLVPIEKLEAIASELKKINRLSMCGNSNLTFKITDEHISFIKSYFSSLIGTSWDHWIRWSNQKQFNLWKSNLELLKKHDIEINLKVSVSKDLVNMSPDWFLDQLDTFAVDTVSLERLTVDGNASSNPDIFPDNEKQDNWYLDLYLRYKTRSPKYNITTLDIIENKLKTNTVKVDTNCRNCEQNMVTINSNGTLGGCPNTATNRSHARLEESVDAFFSSDGRATDIAKELTWHENCLKCDVFDICGGDCHQLPWQNGRCGGLKNTLRYLSHRDSVKNIIAKG